jgi:hypothetical protein
LPGNVEFSHICQCCNAMPKGLMLWFCGDRMDAPIKQAPVDVRVWADAMRIEHESGKSWSVEFKLLCDADQIYARAYKPQKSRPVKSEAATAAPLETTAAWHCFACNRVQTIARHLYFVGHLR